MAQRLFGRQVILQIGQPGEEGLSWSELRVDFRVDYKAGSRGQAVIEVYNLGPTGIAAAQREGALVRVLAGYQNPVLIFSGNPLKKNGVVFKRERPEIIVQLNCRDGASALSGARVSLSFEEPVSIAQAVDEVIAALGIPRGVVRAPEGQLPSGTVLHGRAEDVLRNLLADDESEYTIMNGALQVLDRNETSTQDAPLFSVRTGNLIGSPVRKDSKHIEITALMSGTMRPGQSFGVESLSPSDELVSAAYRAQSVSFVGSRWGNDFYAKILGRAI